MKCPSYISILAFYSHFTLLILLSTFCEILRIQLFLLKNTYFENYCKTLNIFQKHHSSSLVFVRFSARASLALR